MNESLRVRVVYAGERAQHVRDIVLVPGSTVADSIAGSGIIEAANLGEGDLGHVGIFGRVVTPQTLLRDGDRVEIYRDLKVDPKEARRRRARAKGT